MRIPKLRKSTPAQTTPPRLTREAPRPPGNPTEWRALGGLLSGLLVGVLLAVGLGWLLQWPAPWTGGLAVGLAGLVGTLWMLLYLYWFRSYVYLLIPLPDEWREWIWKHYFQRLFWGSFAHRARDLPYPKTLFVRFGRVEGGLARARLENSRPGPGIAILDQSSAAVFVSPDKPEMRIFGPGMVLLLPGWRIVATIDLRPHRVFVGGDAWGREGHPRDREEATLVALGLREQVSARLRVVYALDDARFYEDVPPQDMPAWAKFMGITKAQWQRRHEHPETCRKSKADEACPRYEDLWRAEWEQGRFLTPFYGHRKAAERLAQAVWPELAQRADDPDQTQLPELLSDTTLVQERVAQAWRDEASGFGGTAEDLFTLHRVMVDGQRTELLGWQEIERALRHRFTRAQYYPADISRRAENPKQLVASEDYAFLQARGIRILDIQIEAIYLRPSVEQAHMERVYNPLSLELMEIERAMYRDAANSYRKAGEADVYQQIAAALQRAFCQPNRRPMAFHSGSGVQDALQFFERFYDALHEAWLAMGDLESVSSAFQRGPLDRLRLNLRRLRHFWEENR